MGWLKNPKNHPPHPDRCYVKHTLKKHKLNQERMAVNPIKYRHPRSGIIIAAEAIKMKLPVAQKS